MSGRAELAIQDESRMKNKIKKKEKYRKRGKGVFLLATGHEVTDRYGCVEQVGSSVLNMKDKKRIMKQSREAAAFSKEGNMKRKLNKYGQATSINHDCHGRTINAFEVKATSQDVEVPSSEAGNREKQYKKKKCHKRKAIDSPIDELASQSPQFDILMSDKKKNKVKSDSKVHGDSFLKDAISDVSSADTVRSAYDGLPNNGATSLAVCSTISTDGIPPISSIVHYCEIIQGKRFSKEEDEIIKRAVSRYIKANCLGEQGLDMMLHIRKHPQTRGCWQEITASIPWRLYPAVRKRAAKLYLYHRGRKWTQQEIEFIQSYVRENGKCWKAMADILGVFWEQVFYVWRKYRNTNFRLGRWTQDEYQQVFDMVNMDLRNKAFEEKNDRHGLIRENISWQAISDEMGTRLEDHIRPKWYRTLSSPMVHQGLWSETDDYHLVDRLSKLGAYCLEDVDWDNLLTNRSGDICRRRWIEMTKHIGGTVERPFMEQVDLLSTRYQIDMLEYREKALEKTS